MLIKAKLSNAVRTLSCHRIFILRSSFILVFALDQYARLFSARSSAITLHVFDFSKFMLQVTASHPLRM
jgi:hypothetical protein